MRGKEAKGLRGVKALLRAMGSRAKFLRLDINSRFFGDFWLQHRKTVQAVVVYISRGEGV